MNTQQFKIGIVGMGPVGMILAVHFKQAGCNVAICDLNKEKTGLIKKEGIQLVGELDKSSHFEEIFNSVDELLNSGVNLIVSCLKSFRVDNMINTIKNHNHKTDLHILCAQNGIDIGQKYFACIEESKILRIIINDTGNSIKQNVVKVNSINPPNLIASINDTCTNVAKWIGSILTFTGQETRVINSFTLFDEVWKKTILVSAISPLCGISKLTIKEAMQSSDTIEVIEQTILESMQVAKAEGIKFEDNFVKICLRELKNAGDHFPSLGVDILEGGETEIDYNNGKIVEYGRKHYIQTPLNLTFTNLVNAVSNKNLGKFAKFIKK
ncbi:MAG: ketopantoate reductase C-terminal domain-containing protein [Bacteroidota bacterium]